MKLFLKLTLLSLFLSVIVYGQQAGGTSNARRLQGYPICANAPVNGNLLQWSMSSNCWTPAGSSARLGSVTSVTETFTGGIISVAGSPVTTIGTLALTVAGTSGGIPYFSSSSAWGSSAALAANSLVIGGGAGMAPSTTTTGAGILTFLGTPSSANLRGALTDESGTGFAYFQGGDLGTPSAGVLTNATGLPTTALTGVLQAAQEPAHTGNVTNTAGSLALTIGAGQVTNAMLAGSIAYTKLVGTDIITVGTLTTGIWNA